MPSERQLKRGYLLPEDPQDVLPSGLVHIGFCIPDAPEYRAAVRGAVWDLARYYSWEKTDDDTGRYQLSALIAATLEATYCEGEGLMFRQSGENPCILQTSNDCGTTWSDTFDFSACLLPLMTDLNNATAEQIIQALLDAYDDTVGSVAPNMVYSGDGNNIYRDAALCVALRVMIQGIIDMERERRNRQYNTWDALAGIMTDVGLAIAGTPLGWLSFGLYLGSALLEIGAELMRNLDDAVLTDEEAIQEVACCMYVSMAGATPTASAWNSSLDSCGFAGLSNAEYIRAAISDIIDTTTLAGLKVYLGFLNQLSSVYPLASQGFFDDCPCGLWCYEFDFTLDDGDWYQFGIGGTYVENVGWQTTYDAGTYIRQCRIGHDIDPTVITHIEVTYDNDPGLCTDVNGCPVLIGLWFDSSRIETEVQNPAGDGEDLTLLWEGNLEADFLELVLVAGNTGSGPDPGGVGTITHVTIYGRGTCPFGEPNCEVE